MRKRSFYNNLVQHKDKTKQIYRKRYNNHGKEYDTFIEKRWVYWKTCCQKWIPSLQMI